MGAAASVNTSSIDLLNNDDQSHRNVSEEISPDSEDSNVAEMYMNYARKDVMHKILSNAAGREAFMRFLSVECQGKKLMSSEVMRCSVISFYSLHDWYYDLSALFYPSVNDESPPYRLLFCPIRIRKFMRSRCHPMFTVTKFTLSTMNLIELFNFLHISSSSLTFPIPHSAWRIHLGEDRNILANLAIKVRIQ